MPSSKPKVLKQAEKQAREAVVTAPTPSPAAPKTPAEVQAANKAFKDRVDAFMKEYIPLTQKHGLDFAPILLPTTNNINGQNFNIPNSVSAQLQMVDIPKVPKKKR